MTTTATKATCDVCLRQFGAKGIGSHRRKCLREKEEADRLAAVAAVEMQRGYGTKTQSFFTSVLITFQILWALSHFEAQAVFQHGLPPASRSLLTRWAVQSYRMVSSLVYVLSCSDS